MKKDIDDFSDFFIEMKNSPELFKEKQDETETIKTKNNIDDFSDLFTKIKEKNSNIDFKAIEEAIEEAINEEKDKKIKELPKDILEALLYAGIVYEPQLGKFLSTITELTQSDKSKIIDILNTPKSDSKTEHKPSGLFGKIVEDSKKFTNKNIMLNHYNYMDLLNEENVNPKFLSLFEQIVASAASQGHIITPEIDEITGETKYHYSRKPAKYSIYRHETEHIEALIKHIENNHNSKCQSIGTVIFDPAFPEEEEYNINNDAERGSRVTLHVAWDVETNQHQKLYAERFEFKNKQLSKDGKNFLEIPGGTIGFLHAEAKRYVECYHTRLQKESFLEYYQEQNGNSFIRIKCPDPIEGFKLAIIENDLAQFLLSTIAESQKDLITLFDEFIKDCPIPINTKLLHKYLHHECFDNFICHNAKFDMNRVIETRKKHKSKGFQFILSKGEPQLLKLKYNKQEGITREFNLKLGNINPGVRYQFNHDTNWNNDGISEIHFAPIQTDSQYSSFGSDTLVFSKAARIPPGKRNLGDLSADTKFPKLSEKEMKLEEKQFLQSDFHIKENGHLSKASHYLYRDCLATIAVYGKLTQLLALETVEKATNVDLKHTHFRFFPYLKYILSEATQAKDFLKGTLAQINDLSIQETEYNLKNQRKYFPDWISIKDTFYKEGIPYIHESPIFQGARVTTPIYGHIKPPLSQYPGYKLKQFDFTSQYPHAFWLGCGMKMLELAGKNELHKHQKTDIEELEQRFWYAIDWILKDIEEKGVIPPKALIYLNGFAKIKINKNTPLIIRDNYTKIVYPKKQAYKRPKHVRKSDLSITGTKWTSLYDLAAAVIRVYNLKLPQKLTHIKKLQTIQKSLTFKEGAFINFTADDVSEFGKELLTQIFILRRKYLTAKKITDMLINIKEKEDDHQWQNLNPLEEKINLNKKHQENTIYSKKQSQNLSKKIQQFLDSLWSNLMKDGLTEQNALSVLKKTFTLIQHHLQLDSENNLKKPTSATTVNIQKQSTISPFNIKYLSTLLQNIYHKYSVHTLKKLKDNYNTLQDKLKYLMNTIFGSTAEGISKEFIGKLLTPPVATTVTGIGRFFNNISEIYLCKSGGIFCYAHTDSNIVFAPDKVFKPLSKLFSKTIPLKEETEDIDYLLALGKSKYSIHSAKTSEYDGTDAGSGSWGHTASNSYKEMTKELHSGKNIKEAVEKSIPKFPNKYSINYRKPKKFDQGQFKTIKRLLSNPPEELIPINDRLNIYAFHETECEGTKTNKETGEKEKITRPIERKLFTTTNNVYYNNFGDYRIFPIKKIDKKEVKEKKKLYAQLRIKAKENPKKWRGWSKLKEIKDLRQAILTNQLPAWCIPKYYTGTIATEEAKELAKDFPLISALEFQHLINLVEKLIEDIQLFDFEELDHSLTYDENKIIILNYFQTNEDSISYSEMTDTQLFNELKENLEIDYENNLIKETEYNRTLRELYQRFNKKPPSEREYVNPYPKGANYVILFCPSTIPFENFFSTIINKSNSLTDWERKSMMNNWEDKPSGRKHLKSRYTYNKKFHLLSLIAKHQKIIDKELRKRYPTKTKQKQKRYSIVSDLIFTEKKLPFIELEPERRHFDDKGISHTSLSQPDNDEIVGTDSLTWNLHFTAQDLNVTEYAEGAKNRAISQAIINIGKTMSCEYAKTHIENLKTRKKTCEKYLFETNANKLPTPKKRAIISDSMHGFTIRQHYKAVPIFNVKQHDPEDPIEYDSNFFKITFNDEYDTWLKKETIKEIATNPKIIIINNPDPINERMKEIRNYEWTTYTLLDNPYTLELKKYKDHDYNGMIYFGGVVGKNRVINCNMRFNPTSDKMINYRLFKSSPKQLEEHSYIIKDIMEKIMIPNTKTAFTIAGYKRGASFTKEDYKVKKHPNDLLDKVYLVKAQIMLENEVKKSITQLTQFDMATDIPIKDPKKGKTIIRFINFIIAQAFEDMTENLSVKEKYYLSKKINVGASRKGHATDVLHNSKSKAFVSYYKGAEQLINKFKSLYAEYETPKEIFEHLEKSIQHLEPVIRIETSLKSKKAINNPKSYQQHKAWVELITTIIDYFFKEEKHKGIDKSKTQTKKSLYHQFMNIYEKLYKFAEPQIKAFIYSLTQEIYVEPLIKQPIPIKQQPKPPPAAYG